jgi:hypothetical protein
VASIIKGTDSTAIIILTSGVADTITLPMSLGAVRYYSSNYVGVSSGPGASGTSAGSGINNILIGDNAGSSVAGSGNNNLIAIGTGALQNMAENIGFGNIAIGSQALGNVSYSGDNVAIGYQSQAANTTNGQNTSIGDLALKQTQGNSNSALGYAAGQSLTTGSNNTFIGYQADASAAGLTNATAIGAGTVVSTSNSLILGNGANVGIGTSAPNSTLHVNGSVTLQYAIANTPTYNLGATDHTVRRYGGCSNITFPDASTCPGRIYVIISSNGSVTNVNLTPVIGQIVYDDWIVIGN